jgi:hypothetical protein
MHKFLKYERFDWLIEGPKILLPDLKKLLQHRVGIVLYEM